MVEYDTLFKEIQGLIEQFKNIFSDLENQISKIDDRFHAVELEFMYGNITENVHSEMMKQVRQDITRFKSKLLRLQELK